MGRQALGWLDAERANLVAAVQHAATHGPRPTASGTAEDRRFEADALNTRGTVHQRLERFGEAVDSHDQALRLSREIGVRQYEVAALIGLAGWPQRCAR